MRWQATVDLLRRYSRAWRHAWEQRKQLASPLRLGHEAEFLPAALSLQETPVSPAPQVTMRLLMGFAGIALLWALFGRIDVVATAHGKIIPNDHSKVIQSTETAKVTAIHVRDGQQVTAGQYLLELDATVTEADATRVANDLALARLRAARAETMLGAMQGGTPLLKSVEGVSVEQRASEQRLLEGQHTEYRAKLGGLSAEISRRRAELRSAEEILNKLEQTAPMARQRARDFEDLLKKNFVAKHQYLEQQQAAIEQEQDLAAQRAKRDEIRAALLESTHQREALSAETRRVMLDQLHEAEQQTVSLTQDLIKAENHHGLMMLTAPVDGTVQQLVMHTVGGVVTPAQPLMVIVPKDNPLEVEAFVENKDIGFVFAGQDAEAKIETFPFTKYGTIPAQVVHVSSDAIQDEKRGLVYTAKVKLERSTVPLEEKTVNLSPGMAVTVEIKTGRRRVIEYFLSPLLQYKDESLRER